MSEKQTNFLLGLAAGIAVISLTGFIIMTVAYFQKGKDLSSAANNNGASDSANTVQANDNGNNANGNSNSAPAAQPTPTNVNVQISKDDWTQGDKNAPVTIVEFSDFECPYCARFEQTMQQIMQDYKGKVRWVWKYFPLTSIHPYARKAAIAAQCAGEQGKFWEYGYTLFGNQDKFTDSYFGQLAQSMGLNMNKFNACTAGSEAAQKVDKDLAEGQQLGVNGTPTSFINGQEVQGAYPYDQIKQIIDGKLQN